MKMRIVAAAVPFCRLFHAIAIGNNRFTNPPLCITEDQLREAFEIIDRALELTDAAVKLNQPWTYERPLDRELVFHFGPHGSVVCQSWHKLWDQPGARSNSSLQPTRPASPSSQLLYDFPCGSCG